MIVIFGGAYCGKLNFVKEKFNILEDDIYYFKDEKLNLEKRVLSGLHIFVLECLEKGFKPLEILKENERQLKDKIIICDDISSGIVPMEVMNRRWREETGKCMQYLISKSQSTYRVFFGLDTKLK